MIRKLIIWGLIIFGAYVFYNKFLAQYLESFLEEKKGNVDLLGVTTPTLDTLMKNKESGN